MMDVMISDLDDDLKLQVLDKILELNVPSRDQDVSSSIEEGQTDEEQETL